MPDIAGSLSIPLYDTLSQAVRFSFVQQRHADFVGTVDNQNVLSTRKPRGNPVVVLDEAGIVPFAHIGEQAKEMMRP